jgi:uncharacterized protein YhaN
MEDLKRKYDSILQEKRDKGTEYNNLLKGRSLGDMEEELRGLTNELEDIKESPLPPYTEEVEKEKRKMSQLQGSTGVLERDVYGKKGELRRIRDTKTLEEEKNDATKEMSISEVEIEKLGFLKNDLKDFALYSRYKTQKSLLEDELKKLDDKCSRLDKEKHHLEGRLSGYQGGEEDVAGLEESISAKEEELRRHERQLKINEILIECFSEARNRTLAAIPQTLSQKVGHYISFLTNDRYSKVDIKLKDELSIRAYSEEKGDWIDIDEKTLKTGELSIGALDQLYFATRLALIEIIAHKQCPPILMDDPLVYFDPCRTGKAVEILQELSQRFQILFFTCHDYPWILRMPDRQQIGPIEVYCDKH